MPVIPILYIYKYYRPSRTALERHRLGALVQPQDVGSARITDAVGRLRSGSVVRDPP